MLASFLIFMLFANLFGFSPTGYATLFIQKQGNIVNYKIDNVNDFMQCIDVEPTNDIFSKGACHTQIHKGSEVYGIGSVDYCKNKREVVDYYCSSALVCTEVVNVCPENFICNDGKCVEDFKPFKYFNIKELGKSFKRLFVRIY